MLVVCYAPEFTFRSDGEVPIALSLHEKEARHNERAAHFYFLYYVDHPCGDPAAGSKRRT